MPETQEAPQLGRPITFIAKGANLVLVRAPIVQVPDPRTGLVKTDPGERYDFGEGRPVGQLTFREGERQRDDGPADPDTGLATRVDVCDWLRGHRGFNDLFWEIGNEPGQLKPTLSECMERIAQAGPVLDWKSLEDLIAEERDSHNRDTVLRAAESALEAVRATLDASKAMGGADPAGGAHTLSGGDEAAG